MCFAPRQRGAWIETSATALSRRALLGFAPRQRGAWIETAERMPRLITRCASLPGNGERGLKLLDDEQAFRGDVASLPGNGERGLKPARNAGLSDARHRFAPRQRGAWIETGCSAGQTLPCPASLPGNGERGLKPQPSSAAHLPNSASLPGNGERGLKHRPGEPCRGIPTLRSPATGSVD